MIPRSLLDSLSEELNLLSDEGKTMVLNVIDNAEWNDIAELREIAIEAMEMVCGGMTEMAAARTAVFYDEARELAVGSALGAEALSGRNPKATEGAIRSFIQSVVDTGSTEQFKNRLMERIEYEVKRASNECISLNGANDPLKPRYARVPSGGDTCRFCIMLASRGFDYNTAESASHAHANCDCRIVPGFSENPSAEGYQPAEYEEQYQKMLEGHELDSHMDLLTRNGKTTKRLYKTAEYDYHAALGTKKKSTRANKFKATDGELTFEKFEDVKQYIYGATSHEDLVKRSNQIGNMYGWNSEQMQSQSMKNAFRHMEKKFKLNKAGDPAFDYFGSINESEWVIVEKESKRLGVDLRVSADGKSMGYSPGGVGSPGGIDMPTNASFSAWRHELDHAQYDSDLGFPGITHYLYNPSLKIDMETRAYGVEIEIAKEAGYNNLVRELETLRDAEIERIREFYGI